MLISMALDMYCSRSYIRGKPETGDVDMLILPPGSAAEIDSALALHELLSILHKRVRAARMENWSKDGKLGGSCAPLVLHELQHILAGAEECGASLTHKLTGRGGAAQVCRPRQRSVCPCRGCSWMS